TINVSFAYAFLRRDRSGLLISSGLFALVVTIILGSGSLSSTSPVQDSTSTTLIAIQPNVPMTLIKSPAELEALAARHFAMSETVLRSLPNDGTPRILVWPESPMNFTYGTDSILREQLQRFAQLHHTSMLLNSQETATNDGLFNSALLINQQGSMVSQYDKIRLLPFGEYVP